MLDSPPVFRPDTQTEAEFRARYGDELGTSCWHEFAGKRLDNSRAEALNERVSQRWDAIREAISAVLLPSSQLCAVLAGAGADLTAEAIHLSRSFYEEALLRCREIRNRYTFLDLAADTGRLAANVATL
jgi:glycerol-1-phosphate dehydrogenase [NAD(P)+]